MPREKIIRIGDSVKVIYSREQWELLEELRNRVKEIMKPLIIRGLAPIVHGSVARGDVHSRSDIDIAILQPTPSYIVETALEFANIPIHHKLIVQATPSHTPKAYIFLDSEERESVSFPLAKLKPREYEFYRFGGMIDYEGLVRNVRVAGVNKKLMLIEPIPEGHIETPIIGRESEVATKLGISIETVNERIRVLKRRDEKGRTGVFIRKLLGPNDNIEEALEKLASENPMLRRRLLEER